MTVKKIFINDHTGALFEQALPRTLSHRQTVDALFAENVNSKVNIVDDIAPVKIKTVTDKQKAQCKLNPTVNYLRVLSLHQIEL